MAELDNLALVQRFMRLPLAQRKVFLERLTAKGMSLSHLPIPVIHPEFERLPLSYAQQRQWFLWQFEPDSTAYHVPSVLRLRGALDLKALSEAFNQLVERHASLRTRFAEVDGQAQQIIDAQVRLELGQHDVQGLDEPARERCIEARIDALFDLQTAPLLRVDVLKQGEDDHILVMVLHHIVADGVSMQVLIDELIQRYLARIQSIDVALPALPIQYADYAIWQRHWMEAGERERQLTYWQQRLGDEHPVLELPTDFSRPDEQSHRGARVTLELSEAHARGLKQLAQREGVTPFVAVLASFQLLLHRYSGQAEVRVGVPIANRHRLETAGLIGFFVNTQVMTAHLDGRLRIVDLLKQVKQAAMGAQAHQDLPFEQLVEALHPQRSLSHSPLFQVMLNHQSDSGQVPLPESLGIHIEPVAREDRTSKFDLTLETVEHAGGLSATFIYATDLFVEATVARMAADWQCIIDAMISHPQAHIGNLALPGAAVEVAPSPDTLETAPVQGLHQLFERQAAQTPDTVAVVAGERQLTFTDLDRRSSRLAALLHAHGIGPDVVVGLALSRSVEWVTGVLAVLKAGGAYLALDVTTPVERQQQLLAEAGVQWVLSDAVATQRPELRGAFTTLAMDAFETPALHEIAAPLSPVSADHCAYWIYTSGSTGKPKAVMVRHGAAVHYVQAFLQRVPLEGVGSLAMVSTVAADLGYTQVFAALCAGRTLHLLDSELATDADGFAAYMSTHGIDALKIVPSHLAALLKAADPRTVLPRRCLILGGESASADLLNSVSALAPDCRVFNHYGPSETTIGVLATALDLHVSPPSISLGHALGHNRVYLLNADLQPVPTGVSGELHIAGAGLARGYAGQPAMTAERFVPDPLGAQGERMYRSGDLGRLKADGIHYQWRADDQVKIRGYRVEPGEVASALTALPEVEHAAVLARSTANGRQLVAYVVPRDRLLSEADPATQDAQRHACLDALCTTLPAYMVPAHLIFLVQLPLNANGKLDRKALPTVDDNPRTTAIALPHTPLEQQIADIWQAVLNLPQVGRTDNFFELGGDSIVSIQVVSRARQAGIQFSARQLFQHQTVQGLAQVAQLADAPSGVDQSPVQGALPLLPIQRSFFERAIPQRHHWNQSVLLTPTRALDVALLEQALHALILHHDALRQRFVQDDEGWRAEHRTVSEQQRLWAQTPVLDQRFDVAFADIEALANQVQASLDLSEGPLVRARLLTLIDGTQRLLLVIHHAVVDGMAWRILFEDLQRACQQLIDSQPVALPAKTSSVKQWAERLESWAKGPLLQQLPYWQDSLLDAPKDLPSHTLTEEPRIADSVTVYSRLDAGMTRQLLQQAPAAYRTQVNDLLLTALARVVSRWSGASSMLIQLEGHGREDLFDDIDLTRTVGWFSSKYPVRLDPVDDLAASIKTVKEQLRAAPDKGLGFGMLRHLGDPDTRAALAALPEPRITFNYLGQFDNSFAGTADDKQAGLFQPAAESSGNEQSADAPLGNWLTLNGQVFDGQLSLGWTFSPQRFDAATLEHLATAYERELAALVEHCCQETSRGFTPSDFPLAALSQAQLDRLPLTGTDAVEDLLPLAPMQQGMLFHTLYEQSAGDYINQLRVDVDGLMPERFREAWQQVMDRHEILRSGFVWSGGLQQPLQVVHKRCTVPFSLSDWRVRDDRVQALDRLAASELEQGFDLAAAPLLRVHLVRTADQRHHLIYTHHHILMDGWSSSQLLGEVLQAYAGQALPPRQAQYRDYVQWLQRQDAEVAKAFWLEQLHELDQPTRLGVQDVSVTPGCGDHFQTFDPALTRQLSEFARARKVTVNTLLQAAWLLVLQRHTGQRSVCFGATVAGRPTDLVGVEQQIGLFINTLPVIASPRPEQTVDHWLQAVQAQNLSLREHEHTPLFEIQRWAGQGGEALFDSILVFENYPVSEALQQGAPEALTFGPVHSHEQTNYPLTVTVALGDTLSLHYRYTHQAFSETRMAAIAGHLHRALSLMQHDPQACLGALDLLDSQARDVQIRQWNDNTLPFDRERCIHQEIEAQVLLQPQVTALITYGEALTYAQLNRRSNQLAHRLMELGVGPEVRVGVALHRTAELPIALLAVLKAGGTYVPLDPDYPAERVAYMLEDSRAKVLLTETDLMADMESRDLQVLCLKAGGEAFSSYSDANPITKVDAQNLAYVIYTSGSTGQPKGVAIAHRNVLALMEWSRQVYSQDDLQGVLASTSVCFDLSVWELFVTLSCGGSIVLARNALELPELAARDQVRLINTVPSAIAALHRAGQIPPSVRIINLAGEPLKQSLVESLYESKTVEHVYDLYGPSEDTTYSTWTRREAGGQANIGKPLANTSSYVLDGWLQPAPQGVAAELYLAGEGITRGYLFRPSLTAEKFVPNPFSTTGERLYRTGDLTRYREDGALEYAGRIDHQVKIRGFRIELGEIEACLLTQAELKDVAVLAVDGIAGQQLVAYVVRKAATETDEERLREQLKTALRERLPEYMVPAHWIVLDQLPLTPNGKLDRKALPGLDQALSQRAWQAPVTALEDEVAQIWQDVLHVERVGLTDNFFDLGGHSLLATQVIVRIKDQLRADVPLKTLFETRDLHAFCACVESHRSAHQSLDEELAKSLEALKRLSGNELEKLIS